jgi:hypothetical protein
MYWMKRRSISFEVIVIANAASSNTSLRRSPSPLGRLAFFACALLVCTGGGWLGVLAARPFQKAAEVRAGNDRVEREVLHLKKQNQDAEKEIQALDTREGAILAARRLGWLMPGERHLHIPQK